MLYLSEINLSDMLVNYLIFLEKSNNETILKNKFHFHAVSRLFTKCMEN